ncbi:uncharacterized protein LOC110381819 [Helicoverpa armigera]|uniref:uncharacterized protein LOC110381819 n=1 Tax=Helicoverpa armigera TaxID=29058 RepID=UPI000B369A28
MEPSTSVSNGDADKALNIELLISEIKQRPALYSNAQAEYLERMSKQKEWTEVCQALFKDWNKFSPRKKRDKVREVQTKWLKLKNSFLKSYGGVRKMSPLAKKKKHTHFNSMSFLIPSTSTQEDNNVDNNNEDEESQEAPPLSTAERMVAEFSQMHEVKPTPYVVPVPQIQQPAHTPIDEHLNFALMLIPSLRQLTADQKFIAWTSIIEIIQKAGELGKNISVLQDQLRYPTAGPSGEQGQVPMVQLPPAPGTLEPEEPEEPAFPASHGRPTNPQGEIMYPETDQEDLDEA